MAAISEKNMDDFLRDNVYLLRYLNVWVECLNCNKNCNKNCKLCKGKARYYLFIYSFINLFNTNARQLPSVTTLPYVTVSHHSIFKNSGTISV